MRILTGVMSDKENFKNVFKLHFVFSDGKIDSIEFQTTNELVEELKRIKINEESSDRE